MLSDCELHVEDAGDRPPITSGEAKEIVLQLRSGIWDRKGYAAVSIELVGGWAVVMVTTGFCWIQFSLPTSRA